jgi:hypothetical protein
MSLLTIIQDHCKLHGLNVPSTVVSSQDSAVLQLWALMNDLVENLIDESNWQAFTKEMVWTLVPQEDQGALSSIINNQGYLWLSNETFYDRTLMRKLIGPIGAEEWQALKALPNAGTYWRFRIRGDHLLIYPAPTIGNLSTIAFEYASSFAVVDSAGNAKNTFTADTDTSILPERILKKGLAYRWKELKGLPYSAEQDRYFNMLNNYISRDGTKKSFNLAGRDLDDSQRPTILAAAPPANNDAFLTDPSFLSDG